MTVDSDADFVSWIMRNAPPSLQALATRHGGYRNIPPTAWADFDAATVAWEETRKLRLKLRGDSAGPKDHQR